MVQRSRPPRHLPLEPIDPEGWIKILALGISSLLPILQRQGPIPEGNGTKSQPLT